MSIIVSKEDIKRYLKLDIFSELTILKEKVRMFEKKYKCSLKEFEKRIKKSDKEVFEEWDDYIEWKGYVKRIQELEQKMRAIDNATDFKIIETKQSHKKF